MKLKKGDKIAPFVCDTIDKTQVKSSELLKNKKTLLLFLRFYGCRLCQMDLVHLDAVYDEIVKAGGQAVVVVQSSRTTMEIVNKEKTFKYPIICDQTGELYKQFAVGSAENKDKLVGPKGIAKLKEAEELKLEHGASEGNPLQLPAAFIIDIDKSIAYAYYGIEGGDLPTMEEVLKQF